MFVGIFNIVFVILFLLHLSKIIFISNEIRYLMIFLYLVGNLLVFLKRKPISNNKLSDDDDLFLMNSSPKKPSPSDSDMVKFMADLNRYKEEKKEIEKVRNE
jgi:hypothetical protein